MFAGITRWDLVVMFCLMAAIFIFEMIGVFSPRMITITAIIKSLVPMSCRFMIVGFLIWHFLISDIVRQLTPKA